MAFAAADFREDIDRFSSRQWVYDNTGGDSVATMQAPGFFVSLGKTSGSGLIRVGDVIEVVGAPIAILRVTDEDAGTAGLCLRDSGGGVVSFQ